MVTTTADKALANRYNEEYTYKVWWFVVSFLLLVGVTHYASVALRMLALGKKEPTDVEADGRLVRSSASIRRLPLAVVNAYRVLAFRTTFIIGPYSLNLAEVAITVAYIIVLFVLSFINTTALDGSKFSLTYYMNRTAYIACGQLPFVVALGTKNNFVGLITGLSHEKINYVHRMTARVVFVLLWIHSGARLSLLRPGSLNMQIIQVGILAISSFSLLFVVSLRPVRKSAYELFFFLHFATVLLFLAGGYMHVKESRVTYWFLASLFIWALDRLIRLVHFIAFNHSYFGFRKGSDAMDASVELLSPNFTAYLIMPGVSTFPFEAHPFTIASLDTAGDETRGKTTPRIEDKEASAEIEPHWKELVFFINVHRGFTRRLRDVADKYGKAKVFLDGPYGNSPDLTGYDTSILIAGGSGVSFTLPLLLDGIRQVNAAAGKSNTKRVTFIWSIRDQSHIAWVSESLGAATKRVPKGLEVSIKIYLTGQSAREMRDDIFFKSSKEVEASVEKSRPLSLLEDPAVQVIRGSRPNIRYLLQKEVALAGGRVGVTVCGSQSITAAVKGALDFSIAGPSSIMKGGPSITLHTEAFGYA